MLTGVALANRFSRLVFLPELKDLSDVLWEETLAEFEFAGARDILEAFKKGSTRTSKD